MGWERKRGNSRSSTGCCAVHRETSYAVHVGDPDVLNGSVRYCITLDTDTRLARNVARKLIGIISHPLNRPRFDARVGGSRRVTGFCSRA